MSLKFEDLPPMPRSELEAALHSKDSRDVASALIRMALWERDNLWAERTALAALNDSRVEVRSAALVATGHLARIHKTLHLESVIPAVRKLLDDPECSGIAQDALDDIAVFMSKKNSKRNIDCTLE